jgi:uncharacterized protein YkwD
VKISKVAPPKRPARAKHVAGAPGTLRTLAPAPAAPPPASPRQPTIEEVIIALTNQDRQANGMFALTVDDRLTQAAQIQASAMALADIMGHTLPGEAQPTLNNRLDFVGYNYAWAGENLACGAPDAPSVVNDWMASPPHRQNMLSPIPTAIGVAVAYDSKGTPYYCQVFGASQ